MSDFSESQKENINYFYTVLDALQQDPATQDQWVVVHAQTIRAVRGTARDACEAAKTLGLPLGEYVVQRVAPPRTGYFVVRYVDGSSIHSSDANRARIRQRWNES